MLILTRGKEQSIIIGDRMIEFKILSIKDKQVRVGIMAPKEISVHREEIFNKIKEKEEEGRIREG